MSEGDLRMLGAADGYAHALVRVRQEIGAIDGRYAPRIDAKHVRKRKARDQVMRPLLDLEKWLLEQHGKTKHAYTETCRPTGDPT